MSEPGAPPALEPVAICVATIGRPSLRDLCRSIAPEVSGRPRVEVVVVDNTPRGSAAPLVEEAALLLEVPVRYVAERRPGISAARNAAVLATQAAAAVIFVDDDEVVSPGWLSYMLNAEQRWDADVVMGHVAPVFADDVPPWAAGSGLFALPDYGPPGTVLSTAATGNTLVRRRVFDAFPTPFDDRFGMTGGEDAHFFLRVAAAGFRIVAEPRALVLEAVTAERASVRGIWRRGIRSGIATAHVRNDFGVMTRRRLSARAARNLLAGGWTITRGVLGGRDEASAAGLFRLAEGLGMVSGILGHVSTAYYRRERELAAG